MAQNNRRNKGKAEADKLPLQDFKEQFVLTPDQLRDAREKMSANIGKLNLLLNQYLKNDKRLHQPILNMISLMNYGISYVDDIYRKSLRGGPEREKVTNIREEMTHNNIHVKVNGREAFFTPTHYESYIQIYKDPKVAVEKYLRLKELRAKKKESSWADGKVDSNFLTERIKGKQSDFLMVIRGLYRSLKTNVPNQQVNEKDMLTELGKVLLEALVNRQFETSDGDAKISGGAVSLGSAAVGIVKNKNAEFTKQVMAMIRVCQMEEKDKTLTRINR